MFGRYVSVKCAFFLIFCLGLNYLFMSDTYIYDFVLRSGRNLNLTFFYFLFEN